MDTIETCECLAPCPMPPMDDGTAPMDYERCGFGYKECGYTKRPPPSTWCPCPPPQPFDASRYVVIGAV